MSLVSLKRTIIDVYRTDNLSKLNLAFCKINNNPFISKSDNDFYSFYLVFLIFYRYLSIRGTFYVYFLIVITFSFETLST